MQQVGDMTNLQKNCISAYVNIIIKKKTLKHNLKSGILRSGWRKHDAERYYTFVHRHEFHMWFTRNFFSLILTKKAKDLPFFMFSYNAQYMMKIVKRYPQFM